MSWEEEADAVKQQFKAIPGGVDKMLSAIIGLNGSPFNPQDPEHVAGLATAEVVTVNKANPNAEGYKKAIEHVLGVPVEVQEKTAELACGADPAEGAEAELKAQKKAMEEQGFSKQDIDNTLSELNDQMGGRQAHYALCMEQFDQDWQERIQELIKGNKSPQHEASLQDVENGGPKLAAIDKPVAGRGA